MKPLVELTAAEVARLTGVIFDLDDTVLDHGSLTEGAYSALFRMREAGLRLVACTGRPAGWGAIVQRQWPVDATVVENGALAFVRDGPGNDGRVISTDSVAPSSRKAQRAVLLDLAGELIERFPATALSDDNDARLTDVTLDIGEHRHVAPDVIHAIRAIAWDRGMRTLVSSIHLHLCSESDDKASGTIRVLVDRFGEDATGVRLKYAFIGDSTNDAASFAAFPCSIGVANVAAHLRGLTVPPRYVAPFPMGRGFAAIAKRILALR